MKILDKYIAKNFLIGYAIAFCVLIGLRIIIDLFVNLDEFTEHADLGTLAVIKNILVFSSNAPIFNASIIAFWYSLLKVDKSIVSPLT